MPFRCRYWSLKLRCAWQFLDCRRQKRPSQTMFQQQSVREKLASPTDVAQRLIRAPDRVRSAHSARDSPRATRWNQLLQHFIYLERGIQIAQIVSHLKQTQPDTRHLRVPGKTGEVLPAFEIRLVGAWQILIGFELPQQMPCRLFYGLDGITSPPKDATFKNPLECVGDEMQIIWIASKVDAIDPAVWPEV